MNIYITSDLLESNDNIETILSYTNANITAFYVYSKEVSELIRLRFSLSNIPII